MPVGAYTRQVLGAARPAAERARSWRNVRTSEPDVAGVVGKLTQGAVDAGFVYVTDVWRPSGRLRAIELPAAAAAAVAYAAAAVTRRTRRTPARRARSSPGCCRRAGERALRAAGFGRRRERRGALFGAAARGARWRSRSPSSRCRSWRSSRTRAPGRLVVEPRRRRRRATRCGSASRRAPIALAVIVARRHARRLSARHARVPRPRARGHARRAAARAAARPWPGIALLAALGPQRHPRLALRGRRRAARAADRRAWWWRSRSSPRRSTCARRRPPSPPSTRACSRPRARSAPGEARDVRARRAARRARPGLLAGRRARVGPRARGVRRDAHVRGLLPRRHADGAAGHLRALRDDFTGALALSAVLVARLGRGARLGRSCSRGRGRSPRAAR